MRAAFALTTLALLTLAAFAAVRVGGRAARMAATETPPGVAVVELFTSEGCSSCPPADALLGTLAREDRPGVLPLALHVDYWNRLGWADPNASAANTARQRLYARAMGRGRVYTPQMIVNGTAAFVGSNTTVARRRIGEALARPATARVALEARADGRSVALTVNVDGAPSDAVVHLALVRPETAQRVPRGENRGRTLAHTNVVRALRTLPVPPDGAVRASLALPAGLAARDAFAAAWVQRGAVGEVLGATRADVR